ncbi:hypothetical protein C0J52_22277, partial [Blattella germanica]
PNEAVPINDHVKKLKCRTQLHELAEDINKIAFELHGYEQSAFVILPCMQLQARKGCWKVRYSIIEGKAYKDSKFNNIDVFKSKQGGSTVKARGKNTFVYRKRKNNLILVRTNSYKNHRRCKTIDRKNATDIEICWACRRPGLEHRTWRIKWLLLESLKQCSYALLLNLIHAFLSKQYEAVELSKLLGSTGPESIFVTGIILLGPGSSLLTLRHSDAQAGCVGRPTSSSTSVMSLLLSELSLALSSIFSLSLSPNEKSDNISSFSSKATISSSSKPDGRAIMGDAGIRPGGVRVGGRSPWWSGGLTIFDNSYFKMKLISLSLLRTEVSTEVITRSVHMELIEKNRGGEGPNWTVVCLKKLKTKKKRGRTMGGKPLNIGGKQDSSMVIDLQEVAYKFSETHLKGSGLSRRSDNPSYCDL